MSTPAQTPTLAQAVRTKYPGVYDDLDDATLESRVLAKYPQYGDMPRTQPQTQAAPTATISAAPKGVLPWLQNLESDIRYGSNSTGIGQFLHKIGMQPTTAGIGSADETLATPITGPIHAAEGLAMTPKHPIKGPLKTVGGLLETATIPGAFLAPAGANRAAEGIASAIPSTERAGQAFQEVMAAAKSSPVQTTERLSGALSKYQDLVNSGGSQSLSVRKLLNRVTDPAKGPLTYEEARNFYSNLSRLSADEANRLTPVMKRQVGEVTRALGESIQQTASNAGKGAQYSGAMKEYAQASRMNNALSEAGDYLKKEALQKLPWLASIYAGKKIYDATK